MCVCVCVCVCVCLCVCIVDVSYNIGIWAISRLLRNFKIWKTSILCQSCYYVPNLDKQSCQLSRSENWYKIHCAI